MAITTLRAASLDITITFEHTILLYENAQGSIMKINKKAQALLLSAAVALTSIAAYAEDTPKAVKVSIDDAATYEAPGHFKMIARRLHNEQLGTAEGLSIGYSTFLPGGGADQGSRNSESVYYVLEGQLTITTPDGDIILNKNDSLYRPPGSVVGIINKSNANVNMLVISPARK
jgi:quercetin dioxygenase-like cupin family protein